MSEDTQGSAPMVMALVRVREALEATALPLDLPDVEALRQARSEMLDQLDDYVLPRLVQIDAPLLTVVGGSTGAGKSTLVNSLVGKRVTEPGVLRPTTRSPVLVHNPEDAEWFEKARILPDLERTTRSSVDPGVLQLVASPAVPAGLAVLDAPDIDSVEEQNRLLAAQLLGAADLWLFVTSAARYADQVPWDFLRQAAERSAAVAIVLDRTAPAAIEEVSAHLARMMTARGLRDSPLFVIPEGEVDDEGLLPSAIVREIRTWLGALAADAGARNAVVKQTLEGAIRTVSQRSYMVADASDDQAAAIARLRGEVDSSYARALDDITDAAADGTMLRGEVLSRWQEFVGTGELLKTLESKVSWVRDRVTRAVKGHPQQASKVSVAVESGLQTLVVERAEGAAERAEAAWRSSVAGRQLLDSTKVDLSRASRGFAPAVERAIRDWQAEVIDLIRVEGADKRSTARFLAYGVNGLAVSLMIVVFASTAGITGAEVGIAGASAVLGQKLLEAVFGDQAVRRLAQMAREALDRRVTDLLDSERRRFDELLDQLGIDAEAGDRLRAGVRRVDDVRYGTQPV